MKKCASDDEFFEWVRKITIEEIVISAYFDINDYENPIKYFMEDTWISLRPENSVVVQ